MDDKKSMGPDGGDRGQAPAVERSPLKDREVPLLMIREGEAEGWIIDFGYDRDQTKELLCQHCLRFLAFVRSNAVNVNDGKIWNLGQNGNYWSRTASSSTNGRNLWFNPTDVNPSNSNNRWNGFSLRCILAAVWCRS